MGWPVEWSVGFVNAAVHMRASAKGGFAKPPLSTLPLPAPSRSQRPAARPLRIIASRGIQVAELEFSSR